MQEAFCHVLDNNTQIEGPPGGPLLQPSAQWGSNTTRNPTSKRNRLATASCRSQLQQLLGLTFPHRRPAPLLLGAHPSASSVAAAAGTASVSPSPWRERSPPVSSGVDSKGSDHSSSLIPPSGGGSLRLRKRETGTERQGQRDRWRQKETPERRNGWDDPSWR